MAAHMTAHLTEHLAERLTSHSVLSLSKITARKLIAASAIGLFCVANVHAQAAEVRESVPRISLSATASTEVPHDWMTVNLGTTRDGTDASTVQTQLKAALQAALGVAKPLVDGERMALHTGNFQLSPRYGRDGKINGWQGSVALTLEGRDFERIASLAAKVGTLTVADVVFGLSPQARVALEAELQAQAIERFRAKAQQSAVSFGYTGYRVAQVTVGAVDGGGGGPRPMMAMAMRSAVAESAPLPAEPGRTRVQLSVNGSVALH